MTPPIAATGRIKQPYVVSGRSHVLHVYVRNPQLVGGNWLINSRPLDENDINWHDAVDGLMTAITAVFPSGSTVGQSVLQHRDGGIWNDVDVYTPSITPSGSGAIPASQLTITLKDRLLYNFKFQMMETNEAYPQLFKDPTAGNAALDSLITRLTTHAEGEVRPVDFVVSRLNQYMVVNPFVSCSVFINRKLARRLGL